MAFPVKTITRSALLDGQENGKLDADVLLSTPGQVGGATVMLVKPAGRSWRALCDAAKKAGHILKAGSVSNSYRLYEIQERIFRDRYTLTPLAGRPTKRWNGQTWYQKPNTAVAAVPGTSNHGWAQAVDAGEERDSDAGTESFDDPTLGWLLANADRFGWSWELQSEPWHLRYWAGDRLPAAVLAYEASLKPSPPPATPPEEEDMRRIVKGEDKPEWWITDGITKRHINDKTEAAQLVFVGLATWNTAAAPDGPFVVPQSLVDDITTVPRAKSLT